MTDYLFVDVAQVRIQGYLYRSPKLAAVRGASALIVEATGPAALSALLASEPALRDVEPNAAAGEVSAVLSVRTALPAAGPSEVGSLRAQAEQIAGPLLRHLRSRLPDGELLALWAAGASYVDAYADMRLQQESGGGILALPPVIDLPLLKPCDECRTGPSAHWIREPGGGGRGSAEYEQVCADCFNRLQAGRRRHRNPRQAADFASLATATPTGTGNHLATIAVDGNRVGALFDEVLRLGVGPSVKDDLSRHLNTSMADAVRDAEAHVEATLPAGSPIGPVAVHLLGGDDLLVSVPAQLGPRFTQAVLSGFSTRMKAYLDSDPRLATVPRPSASAGIVFAQQSEPFVTVAEQADELLVAAKREHAGLAPALLWRSLTHEGPRSPVRHAWTLEELDTHDTLLGDLRALWRSQRSAAHSLRRAATLSANEVLALADRLQMPPSITTMVRNDRGADRLLEAIDLTRWWTW